MKIAIMKGGANITFSPNNKSAANADILYALRVINPYQHECSIITHRTRNTVIPKPLKFIEVQDIDSLDDFDVILMFNFSINFFGGAEDINLVKMYRLMSNTSIPIIYVNTDGQLLFKQLWPSIWKRDWAKNYSEEEFYIDPSKVFYLTQGRNHAKISKALLQKPDIINTENIRHYPWETTILANHEKYFTKPIVPHIDRQYDLVFGGATRNTHKRKQIEKYYRGDLIDTMVFGNLRGVNVPHATVRPKVSYQQFIREMQQGKSTVIIGDLLYNNNFHTLRMYESIIAGCLVLIDKQLDPNLNFYRNSKFDVHDLYVNNPKDVANIFDSMSSSELEAFAMDLRKEILDGYSLSAENKRLIDLLYWARESYNI